ncbi:hypothetical protein [Streptomyces sp. NPDC058953]|uniref:hypothetical protein n=1 Tax=unclassified Streptomyces TaxID=2593676 RepID=UPI00369E9989
MTTDTTPGPRAFTFPQLAIALQTLALFFQATTAGMLLFTSHGYVLHDIGSRVMYGASMLYVLAATLTWRRSRGSLRPVLYASGFLLLASAQVAAGITYVAWLHIPLGLLMFGLSVLVLVRALAETSRGRRSHRA